MKKIHILLVAAFSVLSILAEPVKSMLGSELAELQIEEEEQNLWVWPTESIKLVWGNPSTTRYWETGIWYIRMAGNGYTNSNNDETKYLFSNDWFHNCNDAGYSMTQFFNLEEGQYSLSYDYLCERPSDDAFIVIIQYNVIDDGWIYSSQTERMLIYRDVYDNYKSESWMFNVPPNVMTGIIITGQNANNRRGIDVWNVVLKKVD